MVISPSDRMEVRSDPKFLGVKGKKLFQLAIQVDPDKFGREYYGGNIEFHVDICFRNPPPSRCSSPQIQTSQRVVAQCGEWRWRTPCALDGLEFFEKSAPVAVG